MNNFIESTLCLQSGSGHLFFLHLKRLVFTIDVITKFSDSMFLKLEKKIKKKFDDI